MWILCEDKSAALRRKCEEEIQRGLPTYHVGWLLLLKSGTPSPPAAVLQEFQEYLEQVPEAEREALQQLAVLATRKRGLEQRVISQMRLKNWLEAWLYIHLPVSVAMFITVVIHIITIWYY